MNSKLVYDWPLRVFHWSLVTLFAAAYVVTQVYDVDEVYFVIHMFCGLTIFMAILLRICWGVIGEKYSRFSSFALRFSDLILYFRKVLSGQEKLWTGHNPASSWTALAMGTSALSLALTGYMMTAHDLRAELGGIHSVLANVFLALVIGHILGVLLHSLRHKDQLAISLIHGKKIICESDSPISNSRPGVALFFVLFLTAFAIYAVLHFDGSSGILTLFGSELHLRMEGV